MRIGITGWRGFIGSHLAKRINNPMLFQGDMQNLDEVKEFVEEEWDKKVGWMNG